MKLPALTRISFVLPLLVGCAAGPAAGGTTTPAAPPVATTSPVATFAPVPSAMASPATTASPAASRHPERTLAVLPRGFLASGSTEVEGWSGSYCWVDRCVDMAGIPPKSRLPVVTTETDPLEFSLSDGATFTSWTISYGNYSNGEMTILDQGGASPDPDAQPASTPPEHNSVEFDGPPNGDWVVTVFVVPFTGGDLSYAWHVIAE